MDIARCHQHNSCFSIFLCCSVISIVDGISIIQWHSAPVIAIVFWLHDSFFVPSVLWNMSTALNSPKLHAIQSFVRSFMHRKVAVFRTKTPADSIDIKHDFYFPCVYGYIICKNLLWNLFSIVVVAAVESKLYLICHF